VLLTVLACTSPVHFTVHSAPVQPEHLGSYKLADPDLPVVVGITNFNVRRVDTQYPEVEKRLFREHFSVAIPNMVQESLGARQVFSQVIRGSLPGSVPADYEITGAYDFFERIGTQGREWIPFAGIFGAKINEAWIKANLKIRVIKKESGSEVLYRDYPEEHRDRTSIRQSPKVGYLQADYLARISSDIIEAVRQSEGSHR
jgi:hypothetical protein